MKFCRTFTAKTPTETYIADLPGHFQSVVAENIDIAPGSDKEPEIIEPVEVPIPTS